LTDLTQQTSPGPSLATIGLFIALVVVCGSVIGSLSAPGDWYAALEKPAFNPPNWIFAPVWTGLYVLIGLAGARTWSSARQSWRMKLWWLQLGLNFLWAPVFFLAHSAEFALAIVAAMLIAIIAFIITSWRHDRTAALLFLPYAAWVSFASLLNACIVALN
jgi:benzodiazapine receptor